MAKQRINNVSIAGAKLIFKNFAGEPTKFNKAGGKRTFAVVLDTDLAMQLQAEGWNVKFPKEDERYDDPDIEDPRNPYIHVEASYKAIPPKVVVINGEGPDAIKTRLGEEEIGTLDWAQMINCDVVLNPYQYEINGNHGIKAYLGALYVTVVADPFIEKYGL